MTLQVGIMSERTIEGHEPVSIKVTFLITERDLTARMKPSRLCHQIGILVIACGTLPEYPRSCRILLLISCFDLEFLFTANM